MTADTFRGAFEIAVAQDYILCGWMGYLGYELFRGIKEKWWIRSVERVSVGTYFSLQIIFSGLVALGSGLLTVASEANWLSAIIYGLVIPTSLSRWFGGDVMLPNRKTTSQDNDFNMDETTLEKDDTISHLLELLRYVWLGGGATKTNLPYRK